jgi:uncharacterized RDD family membrane protein YckC
MTNKPASFTLRALASITEICYGLLFAMIFILLTVSQPTLTAATFTFFMFLILYFLNPLIIYSSIILTHAYGGSLGKLFTGLQVVNENGVPLSLKRIAFRQTIGYAFAGVLFGLGFVSVIKDVKKQGWHDKAVGSQVVIKQNLWPVAVIVCIVTLVGSIYLGMLSWDKVTTGPLKGETQILMKQIKDETNKQKTNDKLKLSPTPQPILE